MTADRSRPDIEAAPKVLADFPQATAYRRQPMALDAGTSSSAADRASSSTIGLVKAGILEILATRPCTDDEIHDAYMARTAHPRFPVVTPQRLRTARVALVRAGLVRDSGQIAYSRLGNPATAWELAW